eukprot:TRINITY_DN12881_c0_g1_i1.p1 TRINITY_DN12881_c0_g1~~TRINITY_DN12881_c0_g1_i1.p1  ORF type:complete len:215 (+),score=98.84 TRINITY_DN12881_c0_g1_i1:56-646(+)
MSKAAALQEKSVNTTVKEAGFTWEVKGDANMDEITAKLVSLSLEEKEGTTDAAAAARRVLEKERVVLKDAEGKKVELKKVIEVYDIGTVDDEEEETEYDLKDALKQAKAAKKRMTTKTPNPLTPSVDSYIDDEVKTSDAWKSLTLSQRNRFLGYLEEAIEAPTYAAALALVNKAFLAAGKNEERLRDVLPWLVEEF